MKDVDLQFNGLRRMLIYSSGDGDGYSSTTECTEMAVDLHLEWIEMDIDLHLISLPLSGLRWLLIDS